MAVQWTKEQKQVIEARNSSILVSAAAGSGKTAVLVARIMARILDPADPVGIDELLIVTFTKAAAGEMRERIARAIQEAREADPDSAHLAGQAARIHTAQITTIDGFCSSVIRNYGHLISLAPGWRVGEEGEIALLKRDAAAAVMDAAHAEEDPAVRERIVRCVETFAPGKSERPVEEAILRIADAAESSPDPDRFLRECISGADIETGEELMAAPWMRELMASAEEEIRNGYALAERNLALCGEAGGPSQYLASAESDLDLFERLISEKDYDGRVRILSEFSPVRLSTKKNPDGLPEKKDAFKATRSEAERIRKKLAEEYYLYPLAEAVSRLSGMREPLMTLLSLVRSFRARFAEDKEKKGILDYGDLEHFALRILRDRDGSRTYAARELAASFREVMIDEYQDSNYLQEAILTAVSRIEDGENNYFCVGDVKQSIYSFRQARPELFMEKFHLYRREPETGLRIDLSRNFRSRREVIEAVNGIFGRIMRAEVGGIDYDGDAMLQCGADYPDGPGYGTEFLISCRDEEGYGPYSGREARELEARAVGRRILELMKEGEIYDPDLKCSRRPRFSDFVILLRTMRGWSDTFADVLTEMRIPAYSTAKSGYFTAQEVALLLDYLSVLDNPYQDIPFTAVLTGPFGDISAPQLARIRAAGTDAGKKERYAPSMYEAARSYAGGGEDAGIREKLDAFFSCYDSFRDRVPDTPLHELIGAVLKETGFLDCAGAMPGGAQRVTNLQMLVDRAADYERTSYTGLFHFIRYIGNLKSRDQDFGEISAVRENEDAVRICSIHKSKGLEYPIVFAAGLGKQFNLSDTNSEILVHPVMGAASNYTDYGRRVKAPTLARNAIRRRMIRDAAGEELRVLYVALTRAKQKLILTGSAKNEEEIRGMDLLLPMRERVLPAGYLAGVKHPMGWVVPAVLRMNAEAERNGTKPPVSLRFMYPSELLRGEVQSTARREEMLRTLRGLSPDTVYDTGMRELLRERFSYIYPHDIKAQIPVEMSVSELKREAVAGAEDVLEIPREMEAEALYAEEPADPPTIPDFYLRYQSRREAAAGTGSPGKESIPAEGGERRAPAAALTGPARGTAYHHVMERLDFKALDPGSDEPGLRAAIKAQTASLLEAGILTEEETACVRVDDILTFVRSPLGQRVIAADRNGTLRREQPFVTGVPASSVRPEWPSGETVFVQGIIDAFFKEEGKLILLDYKTDRVDPRNAAASAEKLRERYQVQLDLYADALIRVTELPVAEKVIWSFGLGREIEL